MSRNAKARAAAEHVIDSATAGHKHHLRTGNVNLNGEYYVSAPAQTYFLITRFRPPQALAHYSKPIRFPAATMASRGFNTKTPTIKRIRKLPAVTCYAPRPCFPSAFPTDVPYILTARPVKEAAELSTHPSRDFTAAPLEDNLFEWHFTLRGPPAPSPYASGIYHGRIVLPATYPLKPPNFRFLTPTGRFEVNREICLSISGHHEETWQPAWGIRTALVAIRSFMDSEAKGQVGGLECDRGVRERMAGESAGWRCGVCGRSNAEIMREAEEACAETEGEGEKKEEDVPEELRLAYREDLGEKKEQEDKGKGKEAVKAPLTTSSTSASSSSAAQPSRPAPTPATVPAQAQAPTPRPTPTRTVPVRTIATAPALPVHQGAVVQQQTPDRSLQWIDTCIYGVVAALLFMVMKKFAS